MGIQKVKIRMSQGRKAIYRLNSICWQKVINLGKQKTFSTIIAIPNGGRQITETIMKLTTRK